MHSVLFVASVPALNTHQDEQRWENFLGLADGQLQKRKGWLRLSENVWLVDMTIDPGSLAVLIEKADSGKFVYGLLPFERAPEWLPAGFGPTSIPARSAR